MLKTFFWLFFFSFAVCANESAVSLEDADVDVFDFKSVERGAGYFVDHCMGCHSVKHMRYSRIGQDLNLSEERMKQAVMPASSKIHESMISSMNQEDAKQWFGVEAPDLSLVARARGADWLYSYLKGFYADPLRPTGSNNIVYEGVAMPNVLWKLQGVQKPVYKNQDGKEVIVRLTQAEPGTMSPKEFDEAMNDLVNFLVYASEPAQLQRLTLGKYVLFVLILFAVLFYKLKKAYWSDID